MDTKVETRDTPRHISAGQMLSNPAYNSNANFVRARTRWCLLLRGSLLGRIHHEDAEGGEAAEDGNGDGKLMSGVSRAGHVRNDHSLRSQGPAMAPCASSLCLPPMGAVLGT